MPIADLSMADKSAEDEPMPDPECSSHQSMGDKSAKDEPMPDGGRSYSFSFPCAPDALVTLDRISSGVLFFNSPWLARVDQGHGLVEAGGAVRERGEVRLGPTEERGQVRSGTSRERGQLRLGTVRGRGQVRSGTSGERGQVRSETAG